MKEKRERGEARTSKQPMAIGTHSTSQVKTLTRGNHLLRIAKLTYSGLGIKQRKAPLAYGGILGMLTTIRQCQYLVNKLNAIKLQ